MCGYVRICADKSEKSCSNAKRLKSQDLQCDFFWNPDKLNSSSAYSTSLSSCGQRTPLSFRIRAACNNFYGVPDQKDKSVGLGVIILAAGASRRMGKPKLLLPWGATSVLGRLLDQCKTIGAQQLTVVCAADAPLLAAELNRLNFPQANRIFNPDPDRGMFSSIQCAANWSGWKAESTHFLIMLGDQPHLRDETLRQLLDFGALNPERICQPLRDGRRKHPVLLPKRVFVELKTSSARDLRQVIVAHAAELSGFESVDVGLDFDMDTPEDYERVKQLCFGPKRGKI
jgi:molybdenum cofactor cytidylyltransferase